MLKCTTLTAVLVATTFSSSTHPNLLDHRQESFFTLAPTLGVVATEASGKADFMQKPLTSLVQGTNSLHLYGDTLEKVWGNVNNIFASLYLGSPEHARTVTSALHALTRQLTRDSRNLKVAQMHRYAHLFTTALTAALIVDGKARFETKGAKKVALASHLLYLLYATYKTYEMHKDALKRIDLLPLHEYQPSIIIERELGPGVRSGAGAINYTEKTYDIYPKALSPDREKRFIAFFDGEQGMLVDIDRKNTGIAFTYKNHHMAHHNTIDLTNATLSINGCLVPYKGLDRERLQKLAGKNRVAHIDAIPTH